MVPSRVSTKSSSGTEEDVSGMIPTSKSPKPYKRKSMPLKPVNNDHLNIFK